jgi:guanine deaminase
MTREEVFMKRAMDLAVENAASGVGGPFATLIVREGEVLAEATNLVTSTNDPTAHAEIVAIRRACAALNTITLAGCELYASCEPCPMCLGAIYWSHPSAVYYCATHENAAAAGFDDSFIYEQLTLDVDKRLIPMHRLLAEKAEHPFEAWRRNTLRVPY